jgi:signal transduction histidine kinase
MAAVLFYNLEYKKIYPANYYENQLPQIKAYILQQNTRLLVPSTRNALEKVIPEKGILYQVLDGEGTILYGTIDQKIIETRQQLYGQFNTTTGSQGRYIQTVPIIGDDGKISGAVLLFYQLKPTYTGDTRYWWLTVLFIAALFSPFIYMIIFTLVFSKIFTNNVNKPLQLLMDASRKIREKDLDFEVDYHSENELGRLCNAFSEMKEELKNSLSAQWKMEQDRIEMVEALAHDLKTPLSIIRGYSEALIDSDTGSDEKQNRYLAVIKENAEKGSNLVHQMQYTADIESSGKNLNLVPINIISFIEQKVRNYELQAKEKEIEITTEIQDTGDRLCLVDVDKLERILDNIVSNSLHYTQKGGRINISVKLEQNRVFYEISDSGPGFSKKDSDKVFEKFYRGDEARGSKDGHSGLGLYIAKQLVEKHGGSIKAYNTKYGGACIAFDLEVFNSR